jgi:alpha-amylase
VVPVRGLWLMPITASQDHDHGYAVTDYRDLEASYGSLADLDELLSQAHARGIGVILDYVINHSAISHPAFRNASERGNPFTDWYVWKRSRPSGWMIYGNDPWHLNPSSGGGYYFAGFWDQMPDWNLENPAVVRWHHDNLRFLLNRGVDGFRFDAVGNLVEHGPAAWESQPENYALMADIRALVASYQRRYLVCEAPADPAGFAAPTGCGAAFAFGQQGEFVNAAKGDPAAIASLAAHLRSAEPGLALMISNHDSFAGQRLFDQVRGNLAQYKLAAAGYLLQANTPFIYYGEEIGMAGASGLTGDPKLRTPMSWTKERGNAGFTRGAPFRELSANFETYNVAAQAALDGSLLSFYRQLLAVRNRLPALREGRNDAVEVDGAVLYARRSLGTDHVLIALNYGGATTISVAGLPSGAALLRDAPVGAPDASGDASGRVAITLAAGEVAVFHYRD